ncbi:MAG TPA: DUF4440 domain-containing protein [Chitinophagaceae bacterium]|jgi:ketosteroid isomerase-like protein|nr:DUF4440 domain-containing protein [Chitinophagaceae bacterium]
MEKLINKVRPATPGDEAAIIRLLGEVAECFNSGNIDKIISLHTDDVILMESNMPLLQGKPAVRAFLDKSFNEFKTMGMLVQLDFNIAEIEVLLPRAFVRGQVVVTKTIAGKEPVELKGKFFCLFAKQADGSWLRSHIISNTDGPGGH